MTAFQAIILGIIQGIGEFLPISSSGHLIFLPKLFGWADQGLAFDMVLHFGTLVAVMAYFWKRIIEGNKKLWGWIILSAVPAAIMGFFLDDLIETTFRSAEIIAVNLIVWGMVLGVADQFAKRSRRSDSVSGQNVVSMACAQALALIPGTSRSGITMTAGLFSGLSKKAAAEFSFFMSIPITALAVGVKLFGVVKHGTGTIEPLMMGVGFFSAAISGFFAIAILLKIIQKWSFLPFAVYRILIGAAILFWL